MVVGAAGDDLVAARGHGGGEGPGVFDDLRRVLLEFGLEAFAEAHGLGGDHVHERTPLAAGEHGGVDGLGVGGPAEDEAAARAAQRLVRGGGDEIGVRHGRGVQAGGDEAGDVRDVGEKVGADAAGDLAHAREVDDPRVGAGADRDHLRLFAERAGGQLVVVDEAVVLAHAVLGEFVELAGEVGGVAVGEVAAVAEIHAEHLVARLQHGGVDGEVGLRAGMRLHVGVLGAEQLLGALDGERFRDVDELAAAVVALAGISLGILVGQDRALGFENRAADVVFRRDQFDVALLARQLAGDGGVNFGIQLAERGGVE